MTDSKTHRIAVSFALDLPATAVEAMGDGKVRTAREHLHTVAREAAEAHVKDMAEVAEARRLRAKAERAAELRAEADALEREANGAGA